MFKYFLRTELYEYLKENIVIRKKGTPRDKYICLVSSRNKQEITSKKT